MKTAIIHDWLLAYGGAEKVLECLIELFPDADIYSSVYFPEKLPGRLKDLKVKTSFIQKLPNPVKYYKHYLPLMPFAFERFNLSGYDLVISSSHACAKGVIKKKNTCHICYCHTPMRYAWDMYGEYMKYEKFNPIVKLFIPLVMHFIRNWDRSSSKRVDYFIANSGFVAQRIKKYYGRDSVVINPPVDTGKFIPSGKVSDYFLAVSRLVPQKRTDIIIEAFNRLKLPLKVIGKGRDLPGLKKTAGANTEFLGFVPENELCGYMSGCRALVFASLEDFGIVPLEAGSCGRPVIAYGKGGVVDSVVDGRTGIFFDEQTPEAIIDAVNRFQKIRFDPSYIRQFALKFGKEEFAGKLQRYIEEKYNEYKGNTQ